MFKRKERSIDQTYKTHQNWVFWLTAGWLLVTFEHIHYTLSQYSIDNTWTVMGTEIPISDIKVFALVILLEVTLFWSVMFIPATKRLNIKKFIMHIIQGIGISISMFLNIKYMIMASPTDSTMDVAIGAVIGGLIPIFIVLFGYVEGQLVDSQESKELPAPSRTLKEPELLGDDEMVVEYKKDNPHLSIREIAEEFNMPQEEVQKYLDKGRKYET